ncbi:hypothetical protein AAMO2058_001363600 [Amorphochlora amoebiformis]
MSRSPVLVEYMSTDSQPCVVPSLPAFVTPQQSQEQTVELKRRASATAKKAKWRKRKRQRELEKSTEWHRLARAALKADKKTQIRVIGANEDIAKGLRPVQRMDSVPPLIWLDFSDVISDSDTEAIISLFASSAPASKDIVPLICPVTDTKDPIRRMTLLDPQKYPFLTRIQSELSKFFLGRLVYCKWSAIETASSCCSKTCRPREAFHYDEVREFRREVATLDLNLTLEETITYFCVGCFTEDTPLTCKQKCGIIYGGYRHADRQIPSMLQKCDLRDEGCTRKTVKLHAKMALRPEVLENHSVFARFDI